MSKKKVKSSRQYVPQSLRIRKSVEERRLFSPPLLDKAPEEEQNLKPELEAQLGKRKTSVDFQVDIRERQAYIDSHIKDIRPELIPLFEGIRDGNEEINPTRFLGTGASIEEVYDAMELGIKAWGPLLMSKER